MPVTVSRAVHARQNEILTPEALAFLETLHKTFETRRRTLLEGRIQRQKQFDAGLLPDFLPETRAIRDSVWKIAPIPADLQDRRVEITGPVDRKMIVNALNYRLQDVHGRFRGCNFPDLCQPHRGPGQFA